MNQGIRAQQIYFDGEDNHFVYQNSTEYIKVNKLYNFSIQNRISNNLATIMMTEPEEKTEVLVEFDPDFKIYRLGSKAEKNLGYATVKDFYEIIEEKNRMSFDEAKIIDSLARIETRLDNIEKTVTEVKADIKDIKVIEYQVGQIRKTRESWKIYVFMPLGGGIVLFLLELLAKALRIF